MDDIITEFLAETNDSLSELDNDLIVLEQDPENEELISKIFRILHTIKGTCGFLGLPRLEKVAHKGEDVLGLFRDKKLTVTPEYVSLILESFDRIKDIISGLEETGQEPEGNDEDLLTRLEAAYLGTPVTPTPDTAPTPAAFAEMPNLPEQPPSPADEAALPESTPSPAGIPSKAEALPSDANTPQTPVAAQTLRVNVDVLENLMTMVSELVLTRNQLLQISRQKEENEFLGPLQRLNHVVSDLQDGVMKTRMQPIGNAWAKLPRIVRDVCNDLGKKIDLEMQGQDTELDRQILDMIKDPLTHMIRNSADHGIETPQERHAAGKNETGKIKLNAFHQGGHILIEIADDGKGLAVEKIKNKILHNNLASEEQLATMSPQQIQKYIFHAGFSTAEKVTAVSGRGVGMDVVRSNIEKIGGTIELRSEEGKGTTFTIKIPLTLAIVSALIVGAGHHRFAIPQLAISELVLVGKNNSNQIEKIDKVGVLRLREKLLPLLSLAEMLDIETDTDNIDPQYVIVARAGSVEFGLIVDHVYDLEEIVIKPLSRTLKHLPVFSGNTILGDGCVIMILDAAGILKAAKVDDMIDKVETPETETETETAQEHLMLLFRAGNDTLKAVPVEAVSRLEEINTSDIEYSNGAPVIQYLGHLMPLHNLDTTENNAHKRPLVILQHNGKSSALMVDQILDVAKYYGEIDMDHFQEIGASLIINERSTDIVNAPLLVANGITVKEGGVHHERLEYA